MNPWLQFYDLVNPSRLVVALIVQHEDNGTSLIEFPNGTRTYARGQTVAIGDYAFVRGGVVEGPAPAISPITLEV